MRKVILTLLALYGFSATCADGLQIKADGKKPFKDTNAGQIIQYGSGVYVTKHLILTCYHCIEDGVEFSYKLKDGKKWNAARLFAWNKEDDLALIQTEEEGNPVEFLNIPEMTISGSVGNQPVRQSSVFLNNAVLYVGPFDAKQKDASTQLCGSSGSPILADGRLVGIVKTEFNKKETGELVSNGVYVIITSVDVIQKWLNSSSRKSD